MVLPVPLPCAAPRSRLRAELDGAPAELSVEALDQVGGWGRGGGCGQTRYQYMYV